MFTTSTTAIHVRDFSARTTDVDRDMWTAGKMRHVIDALNGSPVAITVDGQTGHTVIGVRLVGIVPGGNGDHARVRIESSHETETGAVACSTQAHLLFTLGPVITPLMPAAGDAKWHALDTHREECSAAIAYASARHGEVEGRAWGSWTAAPGARDVTVTYRPDTGNDFYADQWGDMWCGVVTLEQVAEQQQLDAAERARREAAMADGQD